MKKEIWKTINGFNGYYQISNAGRVRSVDRIINGRKLNSKILSPFITKTGYMQVTLHADNQEKKKYVHRLMMETFCPVDNMENLDIDHIDRNKTNNILENLRWATHKDNMHYWNPPMERPRCVDCGIEIGLHSIRCRKCNLKCINTTLKDIAIKNKDEIYKMALSGMNVCEIAKHFNVIPQSFSRVCRRNYIIYKIAKPIKEKKNTHTSNKVRCINVNTHTETVFNSISEAAKNIGKSSAHIYDACNGARKTAYGYYWEYVD